MLRVGSGSGTACASRRRHLEVSPTLFCIRSVSRSHPSARHLSSPLDVTAAITLTEAGSPWTPVDPIVGTPPFVEAHTLSSVAESGLLASGGSAALALHRLRLYYYSDFGMP
ncbi:hypothetical protein BOTBODRAFT_55728 [Botryobasidium botryosum FD-172 SS1]|uniref:Uncharacterized protein n=1 Tax=Botryobasidium botryosum (strain FD-172 SS1) TaxID=930990 RepID=A0A067MQ36_BOTB1|nr:hypothetical protein BOTBODRAFT_55728 [Botryobasidium botryosum FD-172 SS1]